MTTIARPSLAALAALTLLATPAGAQRISSYDPTPASATAAAASPARPAPRSTEPDAVPASSGGGVDDPLAGNGLGGALCRNRQLAGGLSAPGARTAPWRDGLGEAPVSHYGFDVHIDTGTLGPELQRAAQRRFRRCSLTPRGRRCCGSPTRC